VIFVVTAIALGILGVRWQNIEYPQSKIFEWGSHYRTSFFGMPKDV